MNAVASFQSINLSPSSCSSSSSLTICNLLLSTSSVLPRIFPPETLAIAHLKNNTSIKKKITRNSNNIPFSSLTSLSDPLIFSRKCRLPVLNSQKRPNNSTSEDTDDMFDELFDKYGKVVYSRDDQKRPSDEVDDDAESLSFAVALANVANDVKAGDIRVLFVKPLVYWTRFFIIATAFSRPQIDAIGSKIRDLAEQKFKKVARGDNKPNSWTLLDFGDVVVHIFLPQQRAFYNLEEFYGNATPIELPFQNQNQTPFHS